ncbi:MAG: hypothetical protein GY845_04420 [Planctomycetes bacterium]|nr:hypothetical protein [Planctomycetota bacterium]
MVDNQIDKGEIGPNWQVTATTIDCTIVGHEATIKVNKDWSTACAYHQRWGPIRRVRKKGIAKWLAWLGIGRDEHHLASDCPGPSDCPSINSYRDELRQEESVGRS